MDGRLLFDIQPLVREKIPGFFSDFSGNSCVQKPNKAQKKRANIMGVQYFCGLCYCAGITMSGVNFVLSFIPSSLKCLTICGNFPILPLPPPLTPLEYAAPPLAQAGIRNRNTALPPTSDKDVVPTKPFYLPPIFWRSIYNCARHHI